MTQLELYLTFNSSCNPLVYRNAGILRIFGSLYASIFGNPDSQSELVAEAWEFIS